MNNTILSLGFDDWFQSRVDHEKKDFSLCRVISVNKNSYIISDGTSEIFAELTGKFLYASESSLDIPAAGDWVYVQVFDDNTFAVIHDILPRRTILKRKTPGKKVDYQVIAANIDSAVVIQSLDNNYNIHRLERYLVMINEENINPLVLLSKSDLASDDEIAEKKNEIKKIMPDLEIECFSNINPAEINKIRNLFIPGKTYCLMGSSGVGKTTLLNNLTGEEFKTGSVREKDSRGRHTTTKRELIILNNGAILIDNPGMRELGIISANAGLENTFSEIAGISGECQFKDCTHTVEKGCVVLKALEDGTINRGRYDNYIKMYKESLYNEMSYFEKRQKDKKFGKFMHNYLKNKKE